MLKEKFINITVTDSMLRFFKGKKKDLNIHCFPDLPLETKIKWERDKIRKKYFGQKYLEHRIVVSSTSYSKDEDLNLLINALKGITEEDKILCVITGKISQNNQFKEAFQKNIKNVELKQLWMKDHIDYLKVLSSCDLGISFHKSTSGLDFPMKIIDMISVGIPVCSIFYEEMKNWKKISTFSSESELFDIIKTCSKIENTESYKGPNWEEYSSKLLGLL